VVIRAVYAFLGTPEFTEWVKAYWDQQIPADDPLQRTLGPARIGEAAAWGGPHITICDYASLQVGYGSVVRSVVETLPQPVVHRGRLRLHRGGTQFVLRFESRDLDACRRAIETAIEPLIARAAIVDEEWQRARTWILHCEKADTEECFQRLAAARRAYTAAGCPPLQGAFPWRLNALVDYANRDDPTALQMLLRTGMWPWFLKSGSLHLTLASGLMPGEFRLEDLEKRLWSRIEQTVPQEFTLDSLAIMEPDFEHTIDVMYWDSLTQGLVPDRRPRLRAAERVYFSE